MSYFPILDAKALPELIGMFAAHPEDLGIEADEADLFLEELAIGIAKSGKEGAAFLLNSLANADGQQQKAILGAFAFADRMSTGELLPRIKSALESYFSGPDPELTAAAVDSANGLAFVDLVDSIRGLLGHESPYVVGSVLRFLSAHFPSDAKPQLFKALKSPQPIIRQNAIDELDELDCKEALPCIAGLLDDPDRSVREAAQWAVAHLETV